MLCTNLVELWYTDRCLREEILRLAMQRSRGAFRREEHVREAWLVISTAPADRTTEYYIDLARQAIEGNLWRDRKEALLGMQRPLTGRGEIEGYDEYIQDSREAPWYDQRECSQCHAIKPLGEFRRDAKKPLGRGYVCLECDAARQRGEYRGCEAKLRRVMSDAEFSVYYDDTGLRDHIEQTAIRYAKTDPCWQQDLQQIAWMRIAQLTPGQHITRYHKEAERAIFRAYQRAYRERVKENGECVMSRPCDGRESDNGIYEGSISARGERGDGGETVLVAP